MCMPGLCTDACMTVCEPVGVPGLCIRGTFGCARGCMELECV